MPENNELEKRESESKEQYIARLKERLGDLFERHIKENAGAPLFASEISDAGERGKWEARQLEQWNARHGILAILARERERESEELTGRDRPLGPVQRERHNLELRQRWLTAEGRGFISEIALGLNKPENLWRAAVTPEAQAGLDFSAVSFGGKPFTKFYYAHETLGRGHRDLRYLEVRIALAGVNLADANLTGSYMYRAHLDKTNLRGACLRGALLAGARMANTELQGADLKGANLQNAYLYIANLRDADLREANLRGADLESACAVGARFNRANLRSVQFAEAELDNADMSEAELAGVGFTDASLRGANLDYSNLSGSLSRHKGARPHSGTKTIEDRPARFDRVSYAREWRGPGWFAYVMRALSGKKLAWRKWKKTPETNKTLETRLKEYPRPTWRWSGRPTTFSGVDISGVDWSKNPGLKRDIEDEQFIEDFKEKNLSVYKLWAWSSDCGRSIALWAFWSFMLAFMFALVYTLFPSIIAISEGSNLPRGNFLTYLYFSIVTSTTLGFGDIHANTLVGAFVINVEVILGYVFFGGLIAILSSKLARRA